MKAFRASEPKHLYFLCEKFPCAKCELYKAQMQQNETNFQFEAQNYRIEDLGPEEYEQYVEEEIANFNAVFGWRCQNEEEFEDINKNIPYGVAEVTRTAEISLEALQKPMESPAERAARELKWQNEILEKLERGEEVNIHPVARAYFQVIIDVRDQNRRDFGYINQASSSDVAEVTEVTVDSEAMETEESSTSQTPLPPINEIFNRRKRNCQGRFVSDKAL